MKLNQINSSENYRSKYNTSSSNQSFKGVGTGIVTLMDGIDRGGLAASFIIQDVGGSCIPRTWNGLYRNSDVTGKKNYQEATEVALREFITGPSMVVIPMMILYCCKRYIGKALDVPINYIEGLSGILKTSPELLNSNNLKDCKQFKSEFYSKTFRNILTNSTTGMSEQEIAKKSNEFAQQLIKIETAKSKGIIKNIRNIAVADSREDLTSKICDEFLALTKKSNGDASRNLHTASISTDGKVISANIRKTLGMMSNYAEDVFKKANKSLQNTDSNSVKSFVEHFSKSRIGGRFLLNLGLVASVVAFCTFIPKMYMRSKIFPGKTGLVNNNTNSDNKNQVGMVNNENK